MIKRTGLLTLFLAYSLCSVIAQGDSLVSSNTVADSILEKYRKVNDFVDENEKCLKCHAGSKYVLSDSLFERAIPQSLCPEKIIERDKH